MDGSAKGVFSFMTFLVGHGTYRRVLPRPRSGKLNDWYSLARRFCLCFFFLSFHFQFRGMMPVDLKYVARLSTDIFVSLAHAGCIPEEGVR